MQRGKQDMVLTVGTIDELNLHRKGLLTFLKVADKLQHLPFYLVGESNARAMRQLRHHCMGNNVVFTGCVPDETSDEYMKRA